MKSSKIQLIERDSYLGHDKIPWCAVWRILEANYIERAVFRVSNITGDEQLVEIKQTNEEEQQRGEHERSHTCEVLFRPGVYRHGEQPIHTDRDEHPSRVGDRDELKISRYESTVDEARVAGIVAEERAEEAFEIPCEAGEQIVERVDGEEFKCGVSAESACGCAHVQHDGVQETRGNDEHEIVHAQEFGQHVHGRCDHGRETFDRWFYCAHVEINRRVC